MGCSQPYQFNLYIFQVFLDELNASTCGGFFKEVIIDKMFEGEVSDNAVLISRVFDYK